MIEKNREWAVKELLTEAMPALATADQHWAMEELLKWWGENERRQDILHASLDAAQIEIASLRACIKNPKAVKQMRSEADTNTIAALRAQVKHLETTGPVNLERLLTSTSKKFQAHMRAKLEVQEETITALRALISDACEATGRTGDDPSGSLVPWISELRAELAKCEMGHREAFDLGVKAQADLATARALLLALLNGAEFREYEMLEEGEQSCRECGATKPHHYDTCDWGNSIKGALAFLAGEGE